MRILIQGQSYPTDLLERLISLELFIKIDDKQSRINAVGYFYCLEKNGIVYFLPKIFCWNKFFLGNFPLLDLANGKLEVFNNSRDNNSIKNLLRIFQKSIIEYRNRLSVLKSTSDEHFFNLNSNIDIKEKSIFALVELFFNLFKKHKSVLVFQTVESRSKQVIKPKWSKTIRKTLPFLNKKGQPIYTQIHNKRRSQNHEEELIIVFLSILNHLKKVHQLPISIDKGFQLYKGKRFEWLQGNGLKVLRKVKYKYFSDTLKRMYQLCELYLTKTDKSSVRKRKSEYISIRNYNLIFEDMVDKLFTDNTIDTEIKDLKKNRDGKTIDHLFEYQSLIDADHVYYIGDSKYYKSDKEAKGQSIYKQFTYAKNIIQFQINLFNKNQVYSTSNLRYRDELTEGYNISPNFFIYGFIPTENDEAIINFDESHLSSEGYEVKSSYHFQGRLFDRDTLFVHQYQMNFLFILKAYTLNQNSLIEGFRTKTKKRFRDDFINYFNTNNEYRFYERSFSEIDLESFVNANFRILNGRCIRIENGGKLLVAIPISEIDSYLEIINDFEIITLA
jgi:hypothetical protein